MSDYGRGWGDPTLPGGGNPFAQQTGSPSTATPAKIQMPNAQDLGGQPPVPWVRAPFYPTAPFYSTRGDVGYQTRYYSAGLINTDADYAVGTEAIRTVQFDIPCRLIAINGAAFSTAAGNALPVGVGPRDGFLFRAEYTQGDRLMGAASRSRSPTSRPGSAGAGSRNRPPRSPSFATPWPS